MRLIDLLRMSSGSLHRRKLRTFLTVLGVVIGTASIVVMISLGLGLQQSVYDQVEQSGGVTSMQVSGKGNSMGSMMSSDSGSKEADKYVTDDTIKKIQQIAHVKFVSPVLKMNSVLVQGSYQAYIELQGMNPATLEQLNIPLKAGGKLPQVGSSNLDLVIGNIVPAMFAEKSSGKTYWDTGKIPDIDLTKKASFLMLDGESYMNAEESKKTLGNTGTSDGNGENGGKGDVYKKTTPPKKYVVRASGEVEGNIDSYNAHAYNVYCDLDSLKRALKKEYGEKAIPGQPTKKSGKPYPYLTYSTAYVKADDMKNVETVSKTIRDMGFNVESNIELMDSMKSQMAIIQAVLGGIGAVSLLVAAIGIANTMMMSIYERTKEIGVYKVIGCSLKNIKQMFLLEAAFIGLLGGVIGNLLSLLMSVVINFLAKTAGASMGIQGNISFIPPWLALASMAFAVFVGMAAGYFPALRAMKLSPLAAIRNE
ncbi:MAG: ABC transporter permease [Lachnospiraceae bacterium]